MIPRILIPKDSKALAAAQHDGPGRASTFLDSRQIIPAELPRTPLDARSSIPSHVPLEVLAATMVVPRGLYATPLAAPRPATARLPLTSLDDRVVVPRGAQAAALEIRTPSARPASAVYEPDVLTTGVVNLLARPIEEAAGWNPGGGMISTVSSIAIHGLFVALLLFWSAAFPPKPPTNEEIEFAHRMLGMVYIPPGQPLAPLVPPSPTPQIKVDPRVFKEMAPPEATDPRAAGPDADSAQPPRQLPDAPRPQSTAPPSSESARPAEPQRQTPRFEAPKEPDPQNSPFALPKVSAGRALEDSLRGAAKTRGGSDSSSFGGNLPGSSGMGGGGSGGGQAFGTMELLTPTEGVDFTNYLNRVLARVRYNWFAVIPESARLGEKGIVVLEFKIMKNGLVPASEPTLMRTSGREPLDFASMSSIRSSSPFEPLPPAFNGPFIALRFTYLYNLPLDAIQ